jgi:protein involved in polysaccharide export with SLBB domain
MIGNRKIWNRLSGSIVGSLFVAGLLFSPSAASTAFAQSPSNPPVSQEVDPNYVLGPEDVLIITVRGVQEFTGDYLVTKDGTIGFPIVGTIQVAGMKTSELQKLITDGLKKELKEPQVTVNVKEMRPSRIYILGSVNRPAFYDYKKGWRISELVAVAGGTTIPPERLKAIIFRTGSPTNKVDLKKIMVLGDDSADVELKPGDVVNVQPEAQIRVNVVGEVKTSGIKQIFEGQGAVEALASADGPTDRARLSQAKITRHGQDIPVDLYSAVINGDSSKNIVLEDNDTLYVPQQYTRISVVGTVQKPGSQPLPDGRPWTLSMALGEAGGLAPHAKDSGILTRIGPDGKAQNIKFSYKNLGTKSDPDYVLQDKDVVFMPQSGALNINDISVFGNIYWIAKVAFGI